MKQIFIFLLLCSLGFSQNNTPINFELLEERDGVHYRIDNNKIYSGPVFNIYGKNYYFGKKYSEKSEGYIKNGKFNGPLKYYYKNGQIEYEIDYKDGKFDGLWKTYHDNGQLKKEGTFKDDEEDGPFKYYYKNGQLESERNYKDGKLDGPYKSYHDNGQLYMEGTFKNHLEDGLWKVYYDNGELYHQQTYNNGEEVVSTNCSIVDDWVYPNYENATGAFKFMSNKSFNYSSTFFSITRYGTWKKVDECTYLLIYQNGDTQTVSISGDKYNDMFYIGETGYIRY